MEVDFIKYPYPKRFRHHTAPNLYFPYAHFGVKPHYYPPVFDKIIWSDIFLNGKPPDVLDIGCGKGKFLLDYSEIFPYKNILGIELRKVPVDWIKKFISSENLPNCAAIWYSSVNGFPFIENESIDEIFYLFPDPWPKQKHHKRRAFNKEAIAEFHRILKTGGKIHLATDVEEVHKYHLKLLSVSQGLSIKELSSDENWNFPTTNKEVFCRGNNIPFFRIIVSKF